MDNEHVLLILLFIIIIIIIIVIIFIIIYFFTKKNTTINNIPHLTIFPFISNLTNLPFNTLLDCESIDIHNNIKDFYNKKWGTYNDHYINSILKIKKNDDNTCSVRFKLNNNVIITRKFLFKYINNKFICHDMDYEIKTI